MLSLYITPFLLAGFSTQDLADPPAPRQDPELKRMVEDMEIMRRILASKLSATRTAYGVYARDPLAANRRQVPILADLPLLSNFFSDEKKNLEDDSLNGKSEETRASAFLEFSLRATQQSDAKTNGRSFYVPEVGAFFTFDVSARVKWTETKKDPEHEAAKEDDLWEQVREQVRSGGGGDNPFQRILDQKIRQDAARKMAETRTASWDEEALWKLEETVLEVLRHHGHRMERLGARDQIVVVLKVSPANPNHVYSRDAFLHALNSAELAPLHLVLRIPARLAADFNAKRIDLKGFVENTAKARY